MGSASASASPPVNLIQNPGAEVGASGRGSVVDVPGWHLTAGSFTVDDYGDTDRPSTKVSDAIFGDKNYFFGGSMR
jgi:hypothetical protein